MKTRTKIITTSLLCLVAVMAAGGSLATAAPKSGGKNGGAQAGQRGPQGGPPFVRPAAKFLGMKPSSVMKQLKAGKTLSALATSKGKSVDDLKAAILADAKTHLDERVEDGDMTQAQADSKLSELTAKINDIVAKPMPKRGGGANGGCRPPADGGGAGAPGGSDTGYGNGGGSSVGGTYL